MKIYAVRHGQTDLNAERRIQGCGSDLPLNGEGKRQAEKIAEVLSDKEIDLIVTSPLKRAAETAGIIADRLNIGRDEIITGSRLYERDFGDFEGRLISEIANIDAWRRWTDNAPIPNGESMRELAARVFAFLDKALPKYQEKIKHEHILFVVHGHVLRAMHWYFGGLPKDGEEVVIETPNCGYYEFNAAERP